jgi:hypothetical protein
VNGDEGEQAGPEAAAYEHLLVIELLEVAVDGLVRVVATARDAMRGRRAPAHVPVAALVVLPLPVPAVVPDPTVVPLGLPVLVDDGLPVPVPVGVLVPVRTPVGVVVPVVLAPLVPVGVTVPVGVVPALPVPVPSAVPLGGAAVGMTLSPPEIEVGTCAVAVLPGVGAPVVLAAPDFTADGEEDAARSGAW